MIGLARADRQGGGGGVLPYSRNPLFLMQRSICIARMVLAIWPAGRRAEDAALHLAASTGSSGAEGACGCGADIPPPSTPAASTGAAKPRTQAHRSNRQNIFMGGPDSVVLESG